MRTKILFMGAFLLGVLMKVDAQINYLGTNSIVSDATKKANEILNNPDFISKINSISNFDNTKYSGSQIVQEIKAIKVVEMKDYYKKRTRANATTGKIILINTAKLERPLSEIVNTIIHEYIHSIDLTTDDKWNYTHRRQKEEIPAKSAPWVIGEIAENFVK